MILKLDLKEPMKLTIREEIKYFTLVISETKELHL